MTKYYCDICRKEMESVKKYVLPQWGHKDCTDKHGVILKRIYIPEPTEMEICEKCARIILAAVEMTKVIDDTTEELVIKVKGENIV